MNRTRPSCSGRICAFAALMCLLTLIPSAASAQFLSPGKLAKGHHKLDGDQYCNQCHSSGRKISANACLSCHKQLARRIHAGEGLHGREYRNKDCGQCHIDHLGYSNKLIRWPNGGNKDKLDHSKTGWAYKGAHKKLRCYECHKKKNSIGHTTYLGLSQTCTSCHKDNHQGRFGTQCTKCHDEVRWSSVRLDDFNHDLARFKLKGKHQSVECKKCHFEPPKYTGLQFSTCNNCHEDPHKGRFKQPCTSCHSENSWTDLHRIQRNHPGVSLRNGHSKLSCQKCHDRGSDKSPSKGSRCVSCHKPVHEAKFGRNCASCHTSIEWLPLPEQVGRRSHHLTPFPLRGAHMRVECSQCHNPRLPRERRYRRLRYQQCSDCHKDPHRGAYKKFEEGKCNNCHNQLRFAPSDFGVERHQKTAFPLEGKHAAVRCGGCHQSKRPRYSFKVKDQQCVDCHENPHGDQFASEMRQGGCAFCHSPRGWDSPKIDHSIWPLTGHHAEAPCESCHNPTEADRKAGKGASYRGIPRTCEGCHEDVHAGQFRLTQPVRKCTFCHNTLAFSIDHFEHEEKTGYALTGGHLPLPCHSCHRRATLRNGIKSVRYRLGYEQCADCHANPHQVRGTQ